MFLHLARSLLGDPYQEERELWRALELMATSGNAAAASAASTITGLLVLTIKLRREAGFDASAYSPATAVAARLNDLVDKVKRCPIGGTREEQLAARQWQAAYAAEAVECVQAQLKQVGLYSLFERLWTRISRVRRNPGDVPAVLPCPRRRFHPQPLPAPPPTHPPPSTHPPTHLQASLLPPTPAARPPLRTQQLPPTHRCPSASLPAQLVALSRPSRHRSSRTASSRTCRAWAGCRRRGRRRSKHSRFSTTPTWAGCRRRGRRRSKHSRFPAPLHPLGEVPEPPVLRQHSAGLPRVSSVPTARSASLPAPRTSQAITLPPSSLPNGHTIAINHPAVLA